MSGLFFTQRIKNKKQYQTQCKQHDTVLNPKRFYNKKLSIHILEINAVPETRIRRLSIGGPGAG